MIPCGPAYLAIYHSFLSPKNCRDQWENPPAVISSFLPLWGCSYGSIYEENFRIQCQYESFSKIRVQNTRFSARISKWLYLL